jgi:hypothetical protein
MANGDNNGYVRNSTFIGILTVMVSFITLSGWVVINDIDHRIEAVQEDAREAKKSSAEALRSALTARPDPFTGTDGQKLEERVREYVDNMTRVIRAEDRAATERDDARFTGSDLRLQALETWKQQEIEHQDDCMRERQDLKDRIRELERANGL